MSIETSPEFYEPVEKSPEEEIKRYNLELKESFDDLKKRLGVRFQPALEDIYSYIMEKYRYVGNKRTALRDEEIKEICDDWISNPENMKDRELTYRDRGLLKLSVRTKLQGLNPDNNTATRKFFTPPPKKEQSTVS